MSNKKLFIQLFSVLLTSLLLSFSTSCLAVSKAKKEKQKANETLALQSEYCLTIIKLLRNDLSTSTADDPLNPENQATLNELKTRIQKIEHYLAGKSSGIDGSLLAKQIKSGKSDYEYSNKVVAECYTGCGQPAPGDSAEACVSQCLDSRNETRLKSARACSTTSWMKF